MSLESTVLESARSAARVSLEQLARLLQVDPKELREIARGVPGRHELLADCARLLGIGLDELYAGEFGPAPVLYRNLESSPPTLEALGEDGTALAVGGFLRDLRHADDLEAGLKVRRLPDVPPWSSHRPLESGTLPPHGADDLAREVREKQFLGLEPIDSVWRLAERLGVRCAAVQPEELSPSISGVSWRAPRPMVVVNLLGGSQSWWVTRMTLAHELGHVLFDLPAEGLILSTDRQTRWPERYVALEQRASAFASYLLVPPEAVRRLVRDRNPLDAGFVRHLSRRFQVSAIVAANVLCNVYDVTPHERELFLRRRIRGEHVLDADHPDAHPPPSPRRQLLRAVEHALAAGALDQVSARALLDLRMSEPLPFGGGEPLFGPLQRLRVAVTEYLHVHGRTDLMPDEQGIKLLGDGGYEVPLVVALRDEPPVLVSQLRLRPDFTIVE